jgi:uncharacterized protein (DUF2062 family)
MGFFRKLMPSQESMQRNRWLRWLGPALYHPRLWRFSRKGLALGAAIGVFFGFLIPIAQIPASAAAAVLLRANIPAAAVSTLVTNPVTFGPVYYVAWIVGSAVLGEPSTPPPAELVERESALEQMPDPDESWWESITRRVLGVGKPLVVGLCLFAVGGSLLTYFSVSWIWTLKVRRSRRRQVTARRGRQTV